MLKVNLKTANLTTLQNVMEKINAEFGISGQKLIKFDELKDNVYFLLLISIINKKN